MGAACSLLPIQVKQLLIARLPIKTEGEKGEGDSPKKQLYQHKRRRVYKPTSYDASCVPSAYPLLSAGQTIYEMVPAEQIESIQNKPSFKRRADTTTGLLRDVERRPETHAFRRLPRLEAASNQDSWLPR